jgi:hypothetical protein
LVAFTPRASLGHGKAHASGADDSRASFFTATILSLVSRAQRSTLALLTRDLHKL